MNQSSSIVLASGNQGKVKELSAMLAALNLKVIPQTSLDVPDIPETGTTFIENAIIKAKHASRMTGLPAIADDSGIAIDALGGAPGIYSARYAGEHGNDQANIEKALRDLTDVPVGKRQARFICVLVYMQHADDPTPIVCQGQWLGEITTQTSGTQGFGYDPIFWVPSKNCTAAELSKEQKNTISHRGQALRQLVATLAEQQRD